MPPSKRPWLLHVTIEPYRFVNACTPAGIAALGLRPDYPKGSTHRSCQRIARYAYAAGEAGIAARSAAEPKGEELALFDSRFDLHQAGQKVPFERWYPGAA